MKRYRFVETFLPETLFKDPMVLELVRKMQPDEIAKALGDLGLKPDAARQTAGALMRHSNDSMSMPYHTPKDDSEDDLKKLVKADKAKKRKNKGQMEGFGMDAGADSPIKTFYFRDGEEEDDEWPYDAATKGVMNSPLAGGPRMTT